MWNVNLNTSLEMSAVCWAACAIAADHSVDITSASSGIARCVED